jgi:hypothetical protein
MKRLMVCMLLLGLGFTSALAAAEPRVLRGAEEGARLAAPTRTEAPTCGGRSSLAKDFEAELFPCISVSCVLGGSEGCALACVVSGDLGGGFCIGRCCYCVGDLNQN